MVSSVELQRITWPQLWVLLLGRWLINTTFRIVYPLLPFLAATFVVDLQTVSLLVTLQVAATLASPLGGIVADRWGERSAMLWGLGAYCVGTLVCCFSSQFWVFLSGYILVGIATALYSPSTQAYASARSAYSERGRVLGFLELSWALAAMVGVSSLTQIVTWSDSYGLVFGILFSLGLVITAVTYFGLDGGSHQDRQQARNQRGRFQLSWLMTAPILGAVSMAVMMVLSTEFIFISYASWLKLDFGATVNQIGAVAIGMGVAELIGAGISTLFVDRIGKRRAVMAGLLLCCLSQFALPFSAGNWPLFLALFLLFDLSFEFGIVSYFPLISAQLPQARATMIAISAAALGLARVVGSLLSPILWNIGGFMLNGFFAGGCAFISLLLCLILVREREE